MQFNRSFSPAPGTRFHVQFSLSRIVNRRMHHVLPDGVQPRLVFPDINHFPGPPPIVAPATHPAWFDEKIGTNERQNKEVLSVYNKTHGSSPMVIFGPPGTGKTVTLVEAVWQFVSDQNAYVLICEFQGQERKVIVVSTVRSNDSFLEFDAQHSLGFVKNPKRFNVTMTRAQSGLIIIIGDSSVLELDALWARFLVFIHQKGGWRGQLWDASRFARDPAFSPAEARRRARDELLLQVERQMEGLNLGGSGARSS